MDQPPGDPASGHQSAVDQLANLDQRRKAVEELVDATPDIDPWCSGLDWVLPAHDAFAPEAEPLILLHEGVGAALLAEYRTPDDQGAIAGLEPLWGFASPILGTDGRAVSALLVAELDPIHDWHWLVLPGLPRTRFTADLASELAALGSVGAKEGITRQKALLGDGLDAWFERRSPRFRRSLRQAQTKAEREGFSVVDISKDELAYERCVAVERRSWKGMASDGITAPPMHRFYELMIARLQAQGRFRASIARLDGEDVGFIFGGVRGSRYRGLQLSQVEAVRNLSVSHLLQLHTIRALSDEADPIEIYDLGMDMDYKRRWADQAETSITLVVERSKRGRPSRGTSHRQESDETPVRTRDRSQTRFG